MRSPICTIDTSIVIALDHLDLLPQLSLLFARVLLPKAVRTELFRRRIIADRVRSILDSYTFIERCDQYEQGAVDVLLIEYKVRGVKDRGETETVVQAVESSASVLIDDSWGRKLASRFGLDCHGTLWVLQRFFALGLASSAMARSYLVRLREREIRLPWKIVNRFLWEIGELPIDAI